MHIYQNMTYKIEFKMVKIYNEYSTFVNFFSPSMSFLQ